MQMAAPPLLVLSTSSQSLISPSLCCRFSPPHRRPLAAGRRKFLIQAGRRGASAHSSVCGDGDGEGAEGGGGVGVKNMEFAGR